MRLIIARQEVALVPLGSQKDATEDIFKITFWIDPVQRAAFRNRERLHPEVQIPRCKISCPTLYRLLTNSFENIILAKKNGDSD